MQHAHQIGALRMQIACYKICTVKVNRAVRDRTKQVVDDVARIQENRTK